jgi:hypothetical protein
VLGTNDFLTLVVRGDPYPDTALKLDFVNDVAAHFGDISATKVFARTDSIRNHPFSWAAFRADLAVMARDLAPGRDNSLCG